VKRQLKRDSARSLPVISREPTATPKSAPIGVRVGVVTLGCDTNTVDSEHTMARLASSGAFVQNGARDADVIVINTCGFIESAKEESIEAMLDAVRLKRAGRAKAVVAMGCLVQRYKQELSAEIPEVDAFLDLSEADQLVPLLRERGLIHTRALSTMERPLRLLSTSTPHTSYLKISEGCDHTCAFCAIPLMRGKHRSTPIADLVKEAQELESNGVVELNIVSQDSTWFGRDIVRKTGGPRQGLLPELLHTLVRETSIPWFRLFYMYPSGISRELVDLIAAESRILPYLDMPLQHASDRMLERMRRPERQATIRERVRWLREAIPDLSLRTTLIVGFPGETDEDFAELLQVLEELRFDYIGAFTYSPEEGTAAINMPDQVPDDLKRERLEQLLDLQRSITLEKNEDRVGSVQNVLIDARGRRSATGRTKGQALEVDGVVQITDAQNLNPGDFVDVRITGATEFDLAGELAGRLQTG
jgi:ribosomal protein S12 methylthiotransferase